MNYYEHHIGDYMKKTSHLSPAALGIYQRFIDWCYAYERPLPLRMADLYEIGHVKCRADRLAVERVLELFEMTEEGFAQSRIVAEIERYQAKTPDREAKKITNAEKQRRYRIKRSELYRILNLHKIPVPFDLPNSQLEGICQLNGINLPEVNYEPVTGYVTGDVTAKPEASNQKPVIQSHSATDVASRLGRVARIARTAGIPSVNPSDPRLAALLDAGMTDLEFQIAAAEAAAKQKGWAWLLAALKGRREDAERQQAQPPAKTYRQRVAEARVRAWAPQLFTDPIRSNSDDSNPIALPGVD